MAAFRTIAEAAERRTENGPPINKPLNKNSSECEDLLSNNRSTIDSHCDRDHVASRVERVKRYIAKRSVYVGQGLDLPYRKTGFLDRNTQCTRIQFASHNIDLTLTDSGCQAREWVRQRTGKNCIVGLDVEWRPSFVKGGQNPVALLQLCSDNSCLILQMLYVDFVPTDLVRFLKEPELNLVGVGIGNDLKKLRRDHGLQCKGKVVELASLAAEKLQRNELKTMGLKGLALEVLGLELSKPKNISMSNWASRHLKQKQIEYACIDAFVSFAIGGTRSQCSSK
ncbi:hypothetical protein SUGI_0635590 [Cryptomeria japonica]|nr:hypothetical protein SUGI_0635590 [Cryptomeria japonica]